jgi:Protein of unknown function (DUF2971)
LRQPDAPAPLTIVEVTMMEAIEPDGESDHPADKPAPKVLYRYCSIKGKRLDWFTQTMEQDKIWRTLPSAFNDPFECRFHMNFGASTWEKQKLRMEFLMKRKGMGQGKALKDTQSFFGRPKNVVRAWEVRQQHAIEELLLDETGMVCLSEVKDDILMWSHYADGHRGVCLVFEPQSPKDSDFFGMILPVHYQASIPEVNIYKDRSEEDRVMAMLLTKAKAWCYEREWRFVHLGGGSGWFRIPDGVISGVILGAKMPDADRDSVRELVNGLGREVSLQEAVFNESTYSLDIRPLQ